MHQLYVSTQVRIVNYIGGQSWLWDSPCFLFLLWSPKWSRNSCWVKVQCLSLGEKLDDVIWFYRVLHMRMSRSKSNWDWIQVKKWEWLNYLVNSKTVDVIHNNYFFFQQLNMRQNDWWGKVKVASSVALWGKNQ